jgi:transcription antitermination factor NusG
LAIHWYCLHSKITSKDKFLEEFKTGGLANKVAHIKDILIFDFQRSELWLENEDTLLSGYVLIQIDDKYLKEIVKSIERIKIGKFFGLNKQGLPEVIPDVEVEKFREGVAHMVREFEIGDMATATDGILKDLTGEIIKKKKLMAQLKIKLPNRYTYGWVDLTHLIHAE